MSCITVGYYVSGVIFSDKVVELVGGVSVMNRTIPYSLFSCYGAAFLNIAYCLLQGREGRKDKPCLFQSMSAQFIQFM